MVIVVSSVERAELAVAGGAMGCPRRQRRLRWHGYGRTRTVRGLAGEILRVTPRRVRCADCGTTQILLPTALTLRRADSTEVIGVALAAKAAGGGFRTIAARLGRPPSTVRAWLRRAPEAHAEWLYRRGVERAAVIDRELLVPPSPYPTVDLRLDHLLYGSPVRARVLAAARSPAGADIGRALERAVELLEFDDALDQAVPELRQHRAAAAVAAPPTGKPTARGAALARAVRDHLGLGIAPIPNLPQLIVELTGVDIATAPLGEASGVYAVDPDRDTAVVLVNSDDVQERQRFSLAHELGHLLFGDGAHIDVVDGHRTTAEKQCDEFARNLLIPRDGIRGWWAQALGITNRDDVDERAVALLARHFAVSPDVVRIQLDRAHLLPATLTALPSGRVLAHRYGWGPQYDVEQELAHRPMPPQRLSERATHAYRKGLLGAAAIARLTGRPETDVAESLAEAGVTVERRTGRTDISALIARATANP